LITLLSEALKLAIAILSLLRSENGIGFHKFIQSAQQGETDFRRIFKYAVPAALYLINNLIYYTVLPKTTPSLLQVCVLAKLPATGILHHYMIKPQRNIHAWICLLVLCIGLIIFNVPSKPQSHQSPTEADSAWYLAPIAGSVIACFSALASISAETSIKTGDFWESQAYLYVWGIVFAIIAYPLMPASGDAIVGQNSGDFDLFGIEASILGLVVITATTGLVVAVVLRARDNILKLIGTAASLITVAGSQYVLLPELRASTFTPWRVCGGGIVTISTVCEFPEHLVSLFEHFASFVALFE
jgi:UDP-sugar transporter A1/2/3